MTIGPKGRTVLFSALALASAAVAIVYVNVLRRIDPFASMRGPSGALNPIEIEFHDVNMKHWRQGRLVTSGRIGRIDVHRDHQQFDLYDVSNGVYRTADARFRYEGAHATWLAGSQRLEADGGVHVIGKNFDLRAPGFQSDNRTNLVHIGGPATGTLDGGQTKVVEVAYNLADDSYSTGPIEWTGKLAINTQQPDKSGPPSQGGQSSDSSVRDWHIVAGKTIHDKGKNGLVHYVSFRGTDGVSIVQAPKGTYDRAKDIVTSEGPVKYWGEKANLVCDHLVIYRKEERAVATGNVVIYIKPEDNQTLDDKMEVPPFRPAVPDSISKDRPPAPMGSDQHSKDLVEELRSSETFKKYPATVRADKIVYWYKKGERHAIITGSPQAQQELPEGRWRMAWTHRALYDGEKETLTLISSPGARDTRMKNSLGDDGTATTYVFSTKDGDDSYEADNEVATLKSFDEDANAAAANAGKTKAKPQAKPNTPPPKNPPILQGPIGH
ncbi:MAG: hypothetical protein ACYC96_13780 [Fimbriimonadaceae bacterium]